jgi:hypothetical protein
VEAVQPRAPTLSYMTAWSLCTARSVVAFAASPFPQSIRAVYRTMVTITTPRDPTTLSNYNNWRTKHTILDYVIDFKRKRFQGGVTLQIESLTDRASEEIVLDTSYLDIQDIIVKGGKRLEWKVKDRLEPYGSALSSSSLVE